MNRSILVVLFTGLLLISACKEPTSPAAAEQKEPRQQDALPSWNDGPTKQAIIDFVTQTTSDGPNFIPETDRIACFDNDGTLWSEQPMYFQLAFAFDRVREMAPEHPEWSSTEPFKSVLEGDIEKAMAGGEKSLVEILKVTHTGMTHEAFSEHVKSWTETAKHPKTGKRYTEMVYQPMLELLEFLRSAGYKTFIVSGGGVDFMRVWTEETYGIPSHQVVGSALAAKYEVADGKGTIVKLPEIAFVDDKAGKPVGIYSRIGKRPVFAGGNSDGDYEMLEYTTTGDGPRFALIVHHTDSIREVAYDHPSHIGQLERGLKDAAQNNWTIVDMENDWNAVYPKN